MLEDFRFGGGLGGILLFLVKSFKLLAWKTMKGLSCQKLSERGKEEETLNGSIPKSQMT